MPDAWGICRGLFRPARSPASLPRAADLARFAFAAKAFPQNIRLQLEASVGPTCHCRTGSSAPHPRKPERMGILIQPERAIKVGLRMFMPDGRRLVPSRFQRYLHVPHDSCGP